MHRPGQLTLQEMGRALFRGDKAHRSGLSFSRKRGEGDCLLHPVPPCTAMLRHVPPRAPDPHEGEGRLMHADDGRCRA